MPRLHGYRERMDVDLWDSFHPKELVNSVDGGYMFPPSVGARIRLFGNQNIGTASRTNLQVAGQIGTDQTLVILSWYARTNFTDDDPRSPDFARAWRAWVNAAIATMAVGSKPIRQVPLANLLGPRAFGNLCGEQERDNNHAADVRRIAEKMYRNYVSIAYRDFPPMTKRETEKAFSDLTQKERDVWTAAASVYPFSYPVIVPVRQNFGVNIDADRKATEVLLKVMPEDVAPMPLVWVHLAGLQTRDVA